MKNLLEETAHIPSAGVRLKGDLVVPAGASSIVLFAHGSGSSRLSPRNVFVAKHLQQNKIGTLLFDLLTEEEDESYENRFDIELISRRLVDATLWLRNVPQARNLSFGYFGASTGAAAAINAAGYLQSSIKAVVSRGGRPDLAMESLPRVTAPTLLIVGGLDYEVIQLNQAAFERLNGTKRLEIIAGATHLFEEPGTMDEVINVATKWFLEYL